MWQAALTTFLMIFLAELGDKTQLAVLALAARSTSPWGVFIGAGSALILSSALAVVLGCTVARFIPVSATRIFHYAAGGLFILVGVWTIWKA